jgi:Zn-dependent membrane protease YugP
VEALLWALFLVPLLLGFGAQRLLKSVFARYRRVRNRVGVTGAEVARALLDALGLQRVSLEPAKGKLSDHYDGEAGVLRLSDEVADERSVAAAGIAAHEVSHAYQDAAGSRAYRARKAIAEPLAKLAPWSGFIFVGGFWLGVPLLIVLSLVYVVGLVLFALATLPVELGASRRAIRLLLQTRLVDSAEARGVRRVLSAAALTYVVGLLYQLGLLGSLVIFSEAMRHSMT